MADCLPILDELGNPTGEFVNTLRIEVIEPDEKPNRFRVLLRNGKKYLVSNASRSLKSVLLWSNCPEISTEELERTRGRR